MAIKKVEIEERAGFCPGVVRAVEIAESNLQKFNSLYCLGDIVHNPVEVKRLQDLGLRVISREEFKDLYEVPVMIRAHGEPPETYEIAGKNKLELIDATCRIVGNLQQKLEKAYHEMNSRKGKIIIFGKRNHPETIGLKGKANNEAVIIENIEDAVNLDVEEDFRLFSQTTMNPKEYQEIIEIFSVKAMRAEVEFDYQASVCGWMNKRVGSLQQFAKKMDAFVFVAGKESSNGKYLFNEVEKVNKNAHKITRGEEIDMDWFLKCSNIGISGATSTPFWQLKQVKAEIEKLYASE